MDDTPIFYKEKSTNRAKSGKKYPMPGSIIFWFVATSIVLVVSLISFIGGAVTASQYNTAFGTYSYNPLGMILAMLWFLYTLMTILLVANRIGRLFTAITHLVAGAVTLFFAIFSLIAAVGVSSYSYYGYGGIMAAGMTIVMLLYLLLAGIYIPYGIYLIVSQKSKLYFGDYIEETREVRQPRAPQASNRPHSTAAIKSYCSNCEAEISKQMRYCPECGIELDWGE